MEQLKFTAALKETVRKSGREFAALILAPSILILLIGFLFAQGLHTATIAVFNQDAGIDMPGMGHVCLPDQLIKGLDPKVFTVVQAKDEPEAFRLVKEGKASVALSVPEEFTKEMMIKMDDPTYVLTKKIRLSIDKANPLVTALTAAKIAEALAKNAQGQSFGELPLPVDVSTLTEGGMPNVGAFAMPGIFILLLFIIAVIATSLLTFRLRAENPALNGAGAILAFILLFTVVLSIQAALLFVSGAWIFKVTLPGNLLIGSLSILFLIFCGTAFGTLFSGLSGKTEELPRAYMLPILSIFFSGALLPLELLSGWFRWICYIMPPFYALQAFRGFTLYHRAGAWEFITLGILLGLGLLFTVLAVTAKPKKTETVK